MGTLETMQVIHIPELKDAHSRPVPVSQQIMEKHSYAELMVHPLTQTVDRYIVDDRFHDSPKTSNHKQESCRFHNMKWCPELLRFQSVTSEVINSLIKSFGLKSSSQQNFAHYFFYNRLMDHWHISNVSKQSKWCKTKWKMVKSLWGTSYTDLSVPTARREDIQVSPVLNLSQWNIEYTILQLVNCWSLSIVLRACRQLIWH